MAQKDVEPDVFQIKVLFVDIEHATGRPVVVPFVLERDLPRALKFLYWLEDAPGRPAVIAVGGTSLLSHEMVRLAAQLTEERLAGAGEIRNSQVVSWESTGFKLQTPPHLKQFILRTFNLDK